MYLSLNSAEENVSNVVLKWNVRISLWITPCDRQRYTRYQLQSPSLQA